MDQNGFGFVMFMMMGLGPGIVADGVIDCIVVQLLTLKRSKPLFSGHISFLSSGFGPDIPIFSMCWCWDRIAKRLTWTGIGTTILLPDALEPRPPRLWDVRPALTRFHLARRFWNQILTFLWGVISRKNSKTRKTKTFLTWTSLSLRLVAIWLRSVRLKYFFAWNSLSNSKSCSDVKAVRRRLDFELLLFEPFSVPSSPVSPLGSIVPSSSEHSVSDCSISIQIVIKIIV